MWEVFLLGERVIILSTVDLTSHATLGNGRNAVKTAWPSLWQCWAITEIWKLLLSAFFHFSLPS